MVHFLHLACSDSLSARKNLQHSCITAQVFGYFQHVHVFLPLVQTQQEPFRSSQTLLPVDSEFSSLLPAFPSRLGGQPEPHQAGYLLWAALPLPVVKVVQDQVVPGGLQQTQVGVGGVERLLLGPAVPLTRYLQAGETNEPRGLSP